MWRGDFNKLFKEIIEPQNLIKNFKNEKEFRDWLDLGNAEDIEATLKVFEKAEMYKICAIIKKYMEEYC